MDAKIGDYVVTPRIGKPVEINALWFNALKITAHWADMLGDRPDICRPFAASAARPCGLRSKKSSGIQRRGCLYDVLTSAGPDPSLRPNQLFGGVVALSLSIGHRRAPSSKWSRKILLTPAGLRTLEPRTIQATGLSFDGDMPSRDSAYHQGTVWPWLIGPFISAYLYAFSESVEAKDFRR